MKRSNAPLRKMFTPSLKVVKPESTVENKPLTPYLKAILNGTPINRGSEKNMNLATPDREAALRYIRESALLRK